MDNFKKSEENIVNFLTKSLKEIKPLSEFHTPKMQIVSPQTNYLPSFMKLLGVLLILFILYKLLSFPEFNFSKINIFFGNFFGNFFGKFKKVENDIKAVENNIFDVNNNLNSNQILDFLLGTKPEKMSEWCFVGESKGKRYCALSQGNMCMSGSIFPTQDICINPKLKS